jgi:hypothetical protein
MALCLHCPFWTLSSRQLSYSLTGLGLAPPLGLVLHQGQVCVLRHHTQHFPCSNNASEHDCPQLRPPFVGEICAREHSPRCNLHINSPHINAQFARDLDAPIQ